MDYLDKIKLVTNYRELNTPNNSNVMNISYVYFPGDDQLKKLKREKKISEILDEDPTELDIWGLSDFEEGVVSPKIASVQVTSQTKTEKMVWGDLISMLNNKTKRTYSNKHKSNYDVNTHGQDVETILRNIFFKINMLQNCIAMESRMGSAKTLIVSKDLEYLINISDNIKTLGLNLIIEENLNPKTIIVLRNGPPDTEGIILVREGNNWWEHSTDNWLKNIAWFNVI